MPGNTPLPRRAIPASPSASMRPQRNAGEYLNQSFRAEPVCSGFNEAPAKCRGIHDGEQAADDQCQQLQ